VSGVESRVERKRPAILQISRGISVIIRERGQVSRPHRSTCGVLRAVPRSSDLDSSHYCAPVDLAIATIVSASLAYSHSRPGPFFDSDECKITELSRLFVVGRRLSFMTTGDFNIH